jgi:hypothetical protein
MLKPLSNVATKDTAFSCTSCVVVALVHFSTFLASFPKIGLCDLHPVHVSVYPSYRCKATSRLSVTLYSVLGSGSETCFCGNEYTLQKKNRSHVILYAVRVISKESLWVCLYILLSFLGNGLVSALRQQRRIVGGVVFCAVRVISKESLWVCLYILLAVAA